MSSRKVLAELKSKVRPDKAAFLPGFFKAFPGGYGEGDEFLGVVVPDQRKVALKYRTLPLPDIDALLQSRWHECRLTALFILVHQFTVAQKPKTRDVDRQKVILDFYLGHLDRVNNWDLVDASAHKILGQWLVDRPVNRSADRKILSSLARSKNMWEQRVSVIATLPLIRAGQFDEILRLSEKFLSHPHDLMHKATGWMLREVGKRDLAVLRAFLQEHVAAMPRTMLRYAIEKMRDAERKKWLRQ